jgi:hypothetical protein
VAAFILVIFVFCSLVLSVWAWRSYGSLSQRESDSPTDGPVVLIMIATFVLNPLLLEVLAHYTKVSPIERIGAAAGASVLFQNVGFLVLNGARKKA